MEKLRDDLMRAFYEIATECADKLDSKDLSKQDKLFFANLCIVFKDLGDKLECN